MMRFNGTKVPPDYETRFQLALWAFRHARVYCTTEKVCTALGTWPHEAPCIVLNHVTVTAVLTHVTVTVLKGFIDCQVTALDWWVHTAAMQLSS